LANKLFLKPENYSLTPLNTKFDGNWEKLVSESWVFGIGCANDTTVDSFAILHAVNGEVWKLLVQSKLRKGGSGDHNFSDKDLQNQLSYVTKMNIVDQNWIMFIRTDSSFKATIPKNYQDHIIPIDCEKHEAYYGPILKHARHVSRLQSLGEVWDETYTEVLQEYQESLKLHFIVTPKIREMLKNYSQEAEQRGPKRRRTQE